jgi:hypothetical protein
MTTSSQDRASSTPIRPRPLLFNLPASSHLLFIILLIGLGIGNILFGNYRQNQMNQKDSEIEGYRYNQPEGVEEFPFPLEPDFNLESKRKRKLDHSILLYRFVEKGGLILLLLGSFYLFVIVLWSWWHLKNKVK